MSRFMPGAKMMIEAQISTAINKAVASEMNVIFIRKAPQ